LSKNTIVVFVGSRRDGRRTWLRGKDTFAYEESLHLPFYVVHPDVKGGEDCHALTSHIDVAPTLLAMAEWTAHVLAKPRSRSSRQDVGAVLGNARASE
jgi:arylsulfatase